MRTATVIAAAVTAGVVGAGVLAVPAVLAAGQDPSPQTSSVGPWRGDGVGPGWGRGMGMDGRGGRFGPGTGYRAADRDGCPMLAGDATGSLTATQKRTLARNAEEEKLAHDVYLRLAQSSGDARFTRIAAAESRHLAMVRTLLDRYHVDDPTQGLAEGEFATPAVTAEYRRYVDAGSGSVADALGVGRQIERTDIDALAQAQRGLDAPDVETLYEHLGLASQMHLRAFSA
jgi:hypothetical protein